MDIRASAGSSVGILTVALVVAACSGAGESNTFPSGSGGSAGAGGTNASGAGGSGGVIMNDAGPGGSGGGNQEGCSEETRYVYVIDSDNTMYKFDPQLQSTAAFVPVGPMGCQAGDGPNSMAIGRDGFAYVLYGTQDPVWGDYTCSGVYKVDIKTAACAGLSSFQCGSAGFQKFGMGFATDSATTTNEALYLSNSLSPQLGKVDLGSGQVAALGTLPGAAEFTGNAKGELWGFFPDQTPPKVIQVDKANAQTMQSFSLAALPDLGTSGYAYAFAFWGGSFYIFYDVEDVDTSTNVWKLDANGTVTKYIPNTGLRIVGAGVSTCAPVEAPK